MPDGSGTIARDRTTLRLRRLAAHPVNQLFALLGIESWKPVAAALVLPPVPLLLLVLVGARLMLPRRGLGWFVIVVAVVLLWLSACLGAAQAITMVALPAT